ncbi:hypothetical protein MUP29_12540 [bacterium]|nr:hypothetical protein [bacterium]
MLTGYNTDIKHEGVIYHVQTEDGGTDNPVIVSLIYQGGRILASRKTSYTHLLGTDDFIPKLRNLLEHQHKVMIKAILTGVPLTDQKKTSTESPAAAPSPSGPTQTPNQAHAQAPQPQAPLQVQAPPQVPKSVNPPSTPKPPLEAPPEVAANTQTDQAVEKNLDQVILEYLASEIDKD